ncbi:MAG: hypothetical protein QM217_04120 [Bacillota bacterium]|nr:hypothetical protein [Bacillota bacterium]
MNCIFLGFLILFINFELNLDGSTVGLIPDLLGYMIMIRGLNEMAEESFIFVKIKPYAIGMAIYSGVLYIIDLFGFSTRYPISSFVFSIIATAISMYISYSIIMGIQYTEKKYSANLNVQRLKSTWTVLALMHIITYMLMIIGPYFFVLLCIIAVLIAVIIFLIELYKSKNLYYGVISESETRSE